jgi:hypothetical protein
MKKKGTVADLQLICYANKTYRTNCQHCHNQGLFQGRKGVYRWDKDGGGVARHYFDLILTYYLKCRELR